MQLHLSLCSTVIGSFFQDFVKIFNKIRADVGPELKTCGHTNLNFIIYNHEDKCFFNGHVCTQHKT